MQITNYNDKSLIIQMILFVRQSTVLYEKPRLLYSLVQKPLTD